MLLRLSFHFVYFFTSIFLRSNFFPPSADKLEDAATSLFMRIIQVLWFLVGPVHLFLYLVQEAIHPEDLIGCRLIFKLFQQRERSGDNVLYLRYDVQVLIFQVHDVCIVPEEIFHFIFVFQQKLVALFQHGEDIFLIRVVVIEFL